MGSYFSLEAKATLFQGSSGALGQAGRAGGSEVEVDAGKILDGLPV
jgi:hypothetical protein